ncbi:hypothetical protein [Streptomyces sp. CB01580]|uniref:hypothetical protein n=1 Tax=Streptomyces sp. CB01580 TaxID=1703933 RepID=UPI0018FE47EC|nr:hypothetical protein [Streptomyces sp. CB01580]
MHRAFPDVRFERYADDAVIHCRSFAEARAVLAALTSRHMASPSRSAFLSLRESSLA